MFKKIGISLMLVSICGTACGQVKESNNFSTPENIVVTGTQKKAFQLSSNLLVNENYHKRTLSEISPSVLQDYLNALDFTHVYFLQSDIDEFEPMRGRLSRAVRTADLTTAVQIFERYRERATHLNDWILERLKKPFNLKGNETVEIPDYKNRNTDRPWFATLEDVHDYQEKRLVDAIIRLQLSGYDEAKAIEKLTSRYESLQKRLNQMTIEDVFDVYMNAIASNFDPHSNYLSPSMVENFDMNMSLSLEGIGATLSYEDDKIMVNNLIPGGPAEKSGKLRVKDRIIGVGQGKEGAIQDIIGIRLDNAVKLIRGKKGSIVRLLIEPSNPNEPEREISIVRDKINLEEQAARGNVETITHDGVTRKLGVISLSSFYMDFEGARKGQKDYRSTSRDLAKIIKEMKKQGVEGIILDLRNNGGGSLIEAIKTVGLFIDKGPVVMVSSEDGSVDVQEDKDAGAAWTGPLAVMINHSSASASEIFAGAIQDYKRGVIVGSNSFGKGTVQTVVDLNRFVPSNTPPIGELKLTISMFHRVTGSSTQLKGVAPDVVLPNVSTLEEVGERSLPHALPWKAIPAANYYPSNDINMNIIKQLQEKSQTRLREMPALADYVQYVERVQQENAKTHWSLNLEERRRQYKEWKTYTENYKSAEIQAIPPLKTDEKRKADLEKRNQAADTEEDKETFVPDVGLYEALNVLFDYIKLSKNAANKAA